MGSSQTPEIYRNCFRNLTPSCDANDFAQYDSNGNIIYFLRKNYIGGSNEVLNIYDTYEKLIGSIKKIEEPLHKINYLFYDQNNNLLFSIEKIYSNGVNYYIYDKNKNKESLITQSNSLDTYTYTELDNYGNKKSWAKNRIECNCLVYNEYDNYDSQIYALRLYTECFYRRIVLLDRDNMEINLENRFLLDNSFKLSLNNFIHKWMVSLFAQALSPEMVYTFLDFFLLDGEICLFKGVLFIMVVMQNIILEQKGMVEFEYIFNIKKSVNISEISKMINHLGQVKENVIVVKDEKEYLVNIKSADNQEKEYRFCCEISLTSGSIIFNSNLILYLNIKILQIFLCPFIYKN